VHFHPEETGPAGSARSGRAAGTKDRTSPEATRLSGQSKSFKTIAAGETLCYLSPSMDGLLETPFRKNPPHTVLAACAQIPIIALTRDPQWRNTSDRPLAHGT
jgi:hypothetical protein